MYSIYSEVKSVVAERFMRTLKDKIYRKMTATNQKSYLVYFKKLVDKNNNTYHHSIGKKLVYANNRKVLCKRTVVE